MKQHVLWSETPIARALTKVFRCGKILISFLFLCRSWQLWYKSWLSALWFVVFTTSESVDHEDMFDFLDINIVCFIWGKKSKATFWLEF